MDLETALDPDEQAWFESQLSSPADLNHWSRLDYWTIDEAIVLLLGKNPRVMGSSNSQLMIQFAEISDRFSDTNEVYVRSENLKNSMDRISPIDFMVWAENKGFDFPPRLKQALLDRSEVPNWKARYEDLRSEFDAYKLTKLEEPKDSQTELDTAEACTADEPAQDSGLTEELSGKKKTSLLKLVIGLAICGYKYDPRISRNEAVSEIASDLHKLGISIDRGTVLTWLRTASEEIEFTMPDENPK